MSALACEEIAHAPELRTSSRVRLSGPAEFSQGSGRSNRSSNRLRQPPICGSSPRRRADGERSSKNYAFVNAVARKNVELTVANIRKDSPVLAELESKGAIKMTGAMYNLETGAVEFFG